MNISDKKDREDFEFVFKSLDVVQDNADSETEDNVSVGIYSKNNISKSELIKIAESIK